MRKQKQYKYGFMYKYEYKRYKYLCTNKNDLYSYLDWYKEIKQRYCYYNEEKLINFEKYLNLKIEKQKNAAEIMEFLASVSSYCMSLLMPFAAIIISLMVYLDSLQGKVHEAIVEETIRNTPEVNITNIVVEQLQQRLDGFGQVLNISMWAMYSVLLFIIPMFVFFLFKRTFIKSMKFLEDYKGCIESIKKETLENKSK